MRRTLLKSKIHRATVTDADLNYEGSISIDPVLCEQADLQPFEKVEIYNCNNGNRFSTYVIAGKPGEVCLNGAAARLVHRGDLVIIASYADYEEAGVSRASFSSMSATERRRWLPILSHTSRELDLTDGFRFFYIHRFSKSVGFHSQTNFMSVEVKLRKGEPMERALRRLKK